MSAAPTVHIAPGFQDPKIRKIMSKYLNPPQPQQPPQPQPAQPPQPLPSGSKIVNTVLNNAFFANSEEGAWHIIMAMLDPEFLQTLVNDPDVLPKHKEVATLLLLVLASDCICKKKSNRAKEILAVLEVVKISTEHRPYTCKTDAILDQMHSDAIWLSKNHKCTECVLVPTLGHASCGKCYCEDCMYFTDGRDTVHDEGSTYACQVMQNTMAWANMVRFLVYLARDVVHSSEYKHVSDCFSRLLGVWRCSYCFWALLMLFTKKKGIIYLKDALGIFEKQTKCNDVLWRHVSLLLHMQKVLQMKVRFPLKGESSSENNELLEMFQTKYGKFLPPLSSLSQ